MIKIQKKPFLKAHLIKIENKFKTILIGIIYEKAGN
jgi:hypothetical protein